MSKFCSAFWFRRDLRLDDNAGLFHALTGENPVVPVFIFDRNILDSLPAKDARVEFLLHRLHELQNKITSMGSTLVVRYGYPEKIWPELIEEFGLKAVFTNHDYEPYARKRDGALAEWLSGQGIAFHHFRDQVVFEKEELLTNAGKPYSVFSPFAKKWRENLTEDRLASYDTESHFDQFFKHEALALPQLEEMGFQPTEIAIPSSEPDQDIIRHYEEQRNFPAIAGTTRLGIHLRHGTVSIRKLSRLAQSLSETYLNELIWREFYMQILWNFPHVAENSFRPEYDAIPWRDDHESFEKWKAGKTGYPMVDAAMREIAETGFMHNRSRMIAASFLTKHLLIDWRWGEAYFAEKLLDFELSSNNGGWQWASGSGTDAAPYFRVFNPESQMKKFDPKAKYVQKWVPEFGTPVYPKPIVEHKMARQRCLDTYKEALAKAK